MPKSPSHRKGGSVCRLKWEPELLFINFFSFFHLRLYLSALALLAASAGGVEGGKYQAAYSLILPPPDLDSTSLARSLESKWYVVALAGYTWRKWFLPSLSSAGSQSPNHSCEGGEGRFRGVSPCCRRSRCRCHRSLLPQFYTRPARCGARGAAVFAGEAGTARHGAAWASTIGNS